jgi:hypothetical protein
MEKNLEKEDSYSWNKNDSFGYTLMMMIIIITIIIIFIMKIMAAVWVVVMVGMVMRANRLL